MLLSSVFQELKKQVETVIEREKNIKSELKKKEQDLKTELENSKVCPALKVSLEFFLKKIASTSRHLLVCSLIFLRR